MKILILGFSNSGKAAYELLKDNNRVYIYDKKKINIKNYISYYMLKRQLPFFDLVIRSPGIKITSKVYQLSIQLSRKVISEIELGLNYLKENKNIIAVTGSNGKTTLVNMLHFLLKDRYTVYKLGNIGVPLTSQIKNINKEDIIILELSSFQLENTYFNKFKIGIITNLLDNHFDSVFLKESYFASKLKLINLSKITYVDESILKYRKLTKNMVLSNKLNNFPNNKLNYYNQLYWNIACDIALNYGISKDEIIKKKYQFEMEHFRMEKVLVKDNFIYINDSKSTSISSTNACTSIFKDRNRIIILGGISKKEDFAKIKKEKNDIVICYGKDKLKIFKLVGDYYFTNLNEVIKFIKKRYKKEYFVIFSPACSSLDQYKSYIDRGNHFNLLINK